MKQIGIFSLLNQQGGVVPTDKSALLNTKYLHWWPNPGHRQHTIILEIYEDNTNQIPPAATAIR